MSRDILLFLEDIERSCVKIVENTTGVDRDAALADALSFDGLLFNLYVIGEAVKRLPQELRQEHSDIAWREIAGLRDILAHAYFALDLDIIWDAIQRDVPALLIRVRDIISQQRELPPERS